MKKIKQKSSHLKLHYATTVHLVRPQELPKNDLVSFIFGSVLSLLHFIILFNCFYFSSLKFVIGLIAVGSSSPASAPPNCCRLLSFPLPSLLSKPYKVRPCARNACATY